MERPVVRPLEVTVVADNPETIESLRSYLSGAGVSSHGRRDLRDADLVTAASSALVIFPDELAHGEVVTCICALRSAHPALPIVVVTGAPQRFQSALEPDGDSRLPIVLPKPAFGWTILDTIRAYARSEQA